MSDDIAQRLTRLERQLLRTRIAAIVIAVVTLVLLFVRTEHGTPDNIVMEGIGESAVTLSPLGLTFDSPHGQTRGVSKLASSGLDVNADTGDGRSDARVHADRHGAFMALGAGKIGITQSVRDGSPIVKLRVYGRVESEIQIDTDSGAWTLVRHYRDAQGNPTKPETLQLIGGLSP